MRAKTMRPVRPVALKTRGHSGVGRAIVLAILFSGGLYAIAAALIGMV
jgi:hypothetical protein